MQFSSLEFLYLFLPLVLLCYYAVPKRAKNAVLLLFSLAFYFVGEQELTLLMVASAVCDYFCAQGIEKYPKVKRLFLAISLLFNLGLLAVFKYADLLLSLFNALCGSRVPLLKIALPIGISFYTFQTMSYTIDVYRGKVKAQRNFLTFATYVTLFPQLIAGPIVRYESVAEELEHRKESVENFTFGIRRFCFGLAKKVLLANSLALISLGDNPTVLASWLYAFAVPLQIYFDFSGYSDMAIGLGKMFGFSFPENFDHPFASRSASEFWRRWHITLGSWFRDYLYFPLGGSKNGALRTVFSLLVVWGATGLWHGANATFLLWGLYYGVLIVLEKLFLGKWLKKNKVLSHLYLVLVTVFGFQIFDAGSVAEIGVRFSHLFGVENALCDPQSLYLLLSNAVLLVISVLFSLPLWKHLFPRWQKSRSFEVVASVASLCLLLLCTAYLVDGSYNPFLYFRF